MLSQTTIQELHKIISEDYGIDLKPQEVFEIANSLVGCFDLLSRFDFESTTKKISDDDLHRVKNVL